MTLTKNSYGLYKKCRNCWKYFPAELLSLEIYCPKPECQENKQRQVWRIQQHRSVSLDTFDVYDLTRPLKWGNDFERVCRICGSPLKLKSGKYSVGMRYCKNHKGWGDILFHKWNWGSCRWSYIYNLQKKSRWEIAIEAKELGFESVYSLVYCEECNKLCRRDQYILPFYSNPKNKLDFVNVHHIKPVHTLTFEELHLLFDHTNLLCLCQDCHNKKHQKKIAEPYKSFRKITEFY